MGRDVGTVAKGLKEVSVALGVERGGGAGAVRAI